MKPFFLSFYLYVFSLSRSLYESICSHSLFFLFFFLDHIFVKWPPNVSWPPKGQCFLSHVAVFFVLIQQVSQFYKMSFPLSFSLSLRFAFLRSYEHDFKACHNHRQVVVVVEMLLLLLLLLQHQTTSWLETTLDYAWSSHQKVIIEKRRKESRELKIKASSIDEKENKAFWLKSNLHFTFWN